MSIEPDQLTVPDRVSLDPNSQHYFKWWKKIGVKVDGLVVFTCFEFCISEGWVKLGIKDNRNNFKRERGRPILVTKYGKVETYWR